MLNFVFIRSIINLKANLDIRYMLPLITDCIFEHAQERTVTQSHFKVPLKGYHRSIHPGEIA